MLQDLTFALRLLRRSPGYALAAVLTFALGIGANTAIYSIVDGAVLRPLPYHQPHRLVSIALHNPATGRMTTGVSPREFLDWRERSDVFQAVALSGGGLYTLLGSAEPEELRIGRLTAGYFEMLGVVPAKGRTFTTDDEYLDRPKVALISDEFWRTRFDGDPAILGKALRLDDQPFEIIGVLPTTFEYPVGSAIQTGVFLPFAFSAEDRQRGVLQSRFGNPRARLRDGISIEQASVALSQLQQSLDGDRIASMKGYTRAELKPLIEDYVSDARSWMLMLLGAVGLVLLIACANVANLVLAHGSTRVRELAMRGALGASRWRLARQLMSESVLLSVIGAAVGVMVAWWSLGILKTTLPTTIPRAANIGLDARVLLFTIGVAILTGLLCGLAPALQNSRVDFARGLKEGAGSASGGRAGQRLRNALAVVEVALAMTLLVGAGLFVGSFVRLLNVDLGFDPAGVASLQIAAPRAASDSPTGYRPQMVEMLAAMRAVPGVEVAAAESGGPYEGGYVSSPLQVSGRPAPAPESEPDMIRVRNVSVGFLQVLRVPLLSGRSFTHEDATGAPVALVNDVAARKFWGEANPIGQSVTIRKISYQIVGVVGSMRYAGPASVLPPEAFLPFEQTARNYAAFLFRGPATSIPALKAAVWSVNPTQPISIVVADRMFGRATATRRFNMFLMSIFAVLAIAIALTGIYGVISFLVNQRTREIGVRIALGARRSQVIGLFLRQGLALLGTGVVSGLFAAWLLGSTVRSFLFGVEPDNLVVFAIVATALAAIGLVACWIPAWRASRIEPLSALKSE